VRAIDREAPLQFLRTAFQPDDWVAIFLKSYETGRVTQRVGPVDWVTHPRFQAWLRFKNSQKYNVYCGVNAIAPWKRTRTRDSVGAVRHVFLEADYDGPAVLARIGARSDLPEPSYVLHSSPNRVHIFWRVTAFEVDLVESLQKQLARELGTDLAATPATQATRLVAFNNHKYSPTHLVTIDYRHADRVYMPTDFPSVVRAIGTGRCSETIVRPSKWTPLRSGSGTQRLDPVERARHYLARVPPAIAGQHGDVHTYRVCCRLVRGFALSDQEALTVLTGWNARCRPPWTESELEDKLRRARRYGREPIAALLRS
jgi:RepB DNA-primase N-terminal domain